jgi:Uma2 family endonuclease
LEVFRRQQDTQWLLTDYLGLEAVCRLDSVGIEIPLAELYRNVEFPGTGEV